MTTLAHLYAESDRLCLPTVTEGWCSVEKAHHMIDLILATRPSLVVEIGVFGGRSLLVQALALRYLGHGLAVGIDPWTRDAALAHVVAEEHRDWWSGLDYSAIRNVCLDHIVREGLTDWCTAFVGTSAQFHTLLASAHACPCIDILHIDGNHSEEPSTFDSTHYVPLVHSGGHIWVDDPGWTEDAHLTQAHSLSYIATQATLVADHGGYVLYKKP